MATTKDRDSEEEDSMFVGIQPAKLGRCEDCTGFAYVYQMNHVLLCRVCFAKAKNKGKQQQE